MTRVAAGLRVVRGSASDAVLGEGRRLLVRDPVRLEGARAVGVNELLWGHARPADQTGDAYVAVIIDLTAVAPAPVRRGLSTWSRAAQKAFTN